jgi:hypothetical protein
MHQQSFKGHGIGLPGLSFFFLWWCEDAQPSAIRMITANSKMSRDLVNFTVRFMGYVPVKVKKRN